MGVDDGDDKRAEEGREDRPIPSQSRKKVRREVLAPCWAIPSQLRKKNLK